MGYIISTVYDERASFEISYGLTATLTCVIRMTGTIFEPEEVEGGWLVKAEKCNEIANMLSEHNFTHCRDVKYLERKKYPLTATDLESIQAFAEYCELARSLGGFYILRIVLGDLSDLSC